MAIKDMKVLWILSAVLLHQKVSSLNSVWRFECVKGYCQKREIKPSEETSALSLPECRLVCSKYASIWPAPRGQFRSSQNLIRINHNKIEMSETRATQPLQAAAQKIFKDQIARNVPEKTAKNLQNSDGKTLRVLTEIADQTANQLTLETDESYTLKIGTEGDGVVVNITAPTFFGSRHALETLGQLIIYDDLRGELKMPDSVYIEDAPAYPYRGILLDTSRNYISVDSIKKTINAMAASKLNTFHWHITDSHSFPYVSKSNPELSKYGAYAPSKVYTPEDVSDVVQFARERGVRVLPEFDAPAHVGEGWQNTDFVVCFNKQPWKDFCVEPPCGQFDPTKPKLYDALEGIYGDMIDQFEPDLFHMGGDEVHFNCWNTTSNIVEWMSGEKKWGRTEEDFVKLWNVFQEEALQRLYKKAGRKIPVIMWTSTLTKPEFLKYLPKEKYIVQIWTTGNDPQVRNLLDNDYKLILSNYEALYFDCGFAGWVTDGNNWCAPYIGWQKVYDNSPSKIAGTRKSQILGEEATLWTEQVDDTSVDSRLWPRAAAMAETLWSEPSNGWRDAESRFLVHRERLVSRGVNADALEPEWCRQYEENCPIGGTFNN